MSIRELSTLLGNVFTENNVEIESLTTELKYFGPVKGRKRAKLKMRQSVGRELLANLKKYENVNITEFGLIKVPRSPCGLMRRLIHTDTLTLIESQGIAGTALQACLGPRCRRELSRQFGIKLVAFEDVTQNPKNITLPQNYEVLVLNLLNVLVYEQRTPHVVLFYLSYLCHCAEYLPFLCTEDTNKILQECGSPEDAGVVVLNEMAIRTPLKPRVSRGKRRSFPKGTKPKTNAGKLLGCLLSLFQAPDLLTKHICSIWVGFFSNYFANLVFPPVDPQWKYAKFQTTILYAMLFKTDISGFSVQQVAYRAFFAPPVKKSLLATMELDEEWMQIPAQIGLVVDAIVGQTTSPRLQVMLQDLSQLSALLPVMKTHITASVTVPQRLYNFPIRTILTEWIKGASLQEFFDRNWFVMTELDYATLYFQFMSTLYTIQQAYPGFTHNDTHLGNILLSLTTKEQKFPMKTQVQRTDGVFDTTVYLSKYQYVVSMNSQKSKFKFTCIDPPYKLKKSKKYTEYNIAGQKCYVPDSGFSVHLWDFDLSNISKPIKAVGVVQNQKSPKSTGPFYDVHMFFVQLMKSLIGGASGNSFFYEFHGQHQDLIFPTAIRHFHKKWILQKDIDYTGPLTQKMQRLPDTGIVGRYPSLGNVLSTELQPGGIFARFLVKPPGFTCSNTYHAEPT